MEIQLKVKSYHPVYLERFCQNLVMNDQKFNVINLPQKKEHFTVLRSPHVDKKARDQFERVTYKRLLVLKTRSSLNYLKIINTIHQHTIGVSVEVKLKKNV